MLNSKSHSINSVEARRISRIKNEAIKRNLIISEAFSTVNNLDLYSLKIIGTMLYWAEGGKTQRLVRFANSDPQMIKVMMLFFKKVCKVPSHKFRGYIHLPIGLNIINSENIGPKYQVFL